MYLKFSVAKMEKCMNMRIYNSEKIEIVVKDFLGTEIDRINILPQMNPLSELPQDKAALFEFMKA